MQSFLILSFFIFVYLNFFYVACIQQFVCFLKVSTDAVSDNDSILFKQIINFVTKGEMNVKCN